MLACERLTSPVCRCPDATPASDQIADDRKVVTIAQIGLGIVLGVIALALLAVPGFLVGGSVALLLGRLTRFSKGRVRLAVVIWAVLCLAITGFAIVQVEGASKPDALASLAELFFILLGVGTAAGGGYGLYRGESRATRISVGPTGLSG